MRHPFSDVFPIGTSTFSASRRVGYQRKMYEVTNLNFNLTAGKPVVSASDGWGIPS